jgi:hypothetical protein
MSDPLSKPMSEGTPAQKLDSSADAVDYGKVIGVGVASLMLFAISIAWAGKLMHGAQADIEAKSGHAREFDTKRMEIGIVDQVPFDADRRLPTWRAERKAYLEGYGWVDRAKGVAHIPIEQAIDQILAGASPTGAPK